MKSIIKATVLVAAVFLSTLPAKAGNGVWEREQRGSEVGYHIDYQGYRLFVYCPQQGGTVSHYGQISLFELANSKPVKNFTVTIGKVNLAAPIDAGDMAGESNFLKAVDTLRKGAATVKFGTTVINFPLNGAEKVIPASKSKEFNCRTIWQE